MSLSFLHFVVDSEWMVSHRAFHSEFVGSLAGSVGEIEKVTPLFQIANRMDL